MVPVREADEQFAVRVRHHIAADQIYERISDNVECSRFSEQEWYTTREQTITKLDHKMNEPKSILLFRADVHVFTFNDHCGTFIHSHIVLLVDVPTPKQLDNCNINKYFDSSTWYSYTF